MKVLLSGRKSQRDTNKRVLSFLAILAFIIVLIVSFIPAVTEQQQALNAFAQAVGKNQYAHPHRMEEYRKRMWLYSRDGTNLPPIILNAAEAEQKLTARCDWTVVLSNCASVLEGKVFSKKFGIFFEF